MMKGVLGIIARPHALLRPLVCGDETMQPQSMRPELPARRDDVCKGNGVANPFHASIGYVVR